MGATLRSSIVLNTGVYSRDLGGEAVILNMNTGKYHGLNALAARMWFALMEHGRVDACLDTLLDEYEIGEADLERDLIRFVDEMVARKILRLA